MDFKVVFENLLSAFDKNKVRYGLIGGIAMGLHGYSRSTTDIDFLVHRDDLAKVDASMKELGYDCIYRSENATQFVSPLKVFGEVDFIHAFRDASVDMLQRAEDKKIFNDAMFIKVLKVEDIIGLKVQAMANDESRKALDLSDIESLLALHSATIDWDMLEKYFFLFKVSDIFMELKRKYYHAD
jgi:hypothetical protein